MPTENYSKEKNKQKGKEAERDTYISALVGTVSVAIVNSLASVAGVQVTGETKIALSGALGFFIMGKVSSYLKKRKNKRKFTA